MPRVAFSTENKVAQTNYDFPKLFLKKGEQARILVGLEDPIVEYVHTLQAPKIVDGKPVYKEIERRKEKVKVNDNDFIGRPLCLGDISTLQEDGVDPKRCPICAAAKKYPDMFNAPQRRYAMHIIRYKTKSGSFDLVNPYNVETVVWSFTDRTFNKIVDFANEWGDLKKHDLMLGPCTIENYQQYDINVGAKAAWLEGGKDRAQITKETFENQQIEDLSIACGSKKEERWIKQDIETIIDRWAEVNRLEGNAPADDVSDTSLETDLTSLMDGKVEKDEEGWAKEAPRIEDSPATAESTDDTDDLLSSLGSDDDSSSETTEEKAPAEETGEDMNFDDLLDSLNK